MTVNHILSDLGFSKDIKVREEALESLTRRITEASVTTRQALAPFAVNADQHQDAVIKSSASTIRMVAPAVQARPRRSSTACCIESSRA